MAGVSQRPVTTVVGRIPGFHGATVHPVAQHGFKRRNWGSHQVAATPPKNVLVTLTASQNQSTNTAYHSTHQFITLYTQSNVTNAPSTEVLGGGLLFGGTGLLAGTSSGSHTVIQLGAVRSKTLSVGESTTLLLPKSVTSSVPITQAVSGITNKTIFKSIIISQGESAVVLTVKSIFRTVSTTQSETLGIFKSFGKQVSSSQGQLALLSRNMAMFRTSNVSEVLSIQRIANKYRSVSTTQNNSVVIRKLILSTLSSIQGTTLSLASQSFRTVILIVGESITPIVFKSILHTITRTQSSSSIINRAISKIIAATQAENVIISRTSLRNNIVSQSENIVIIRNMGIHISASQTELALLSRTMAIFRNFVLTQPQTPSLLTIKVYLRTLSTTSSVSPKKFSLTIHVLNSSQSSTTTISRRLQINNILSASVSSSPFILRSIPIIRSITQSNLSVLQSQISRILRATQSETPTVSTIRLRVKTFTIAQSENVVVSRQISKSIIITQSTNGIVTKVVPLFRTISTTQAQIGQIVNNISPIKIATQANQISIARGISVIKRITESPIITRTGIHQLSQNITASQSTSSVLSKRILRPLYVYQLVTNEPSTEVLGGGLVFGGTGLFAGRSSPGQTVIRVNYVKTSRLTVAQATTASVLRLNARIFTRTQGTTPVITRAISKTIMVNQNQNISILTARSIFRTINASQNENANIAKNANIHNSSSQVQLALLSRAMAVFRNTNVSESLIISRVKAINKTFTLAQNNNISLTRTIFESRTFQITQSAIASNSHQTALGRSLFATQTTQTSVTTSNSTISRTITTNQAQISAISRNPVIVKFTTIGQTASVNRSMSKVLIASQGENVSVLRSNFKIITITQPVLISRNFSTPRINVVSQPQIANLIRNVRLSKNVTQSQQAGVSHTFAITRTVTEAVIATNTHQLSGIRTLTATQASTGSVARQAQYTRTLLGTSNTSTTLPRTTSASKTIGVGETATVRRILGRIVVVSQNSSISLLRNNARVVQLAQNTAITKSIIVLHQNMATQGQTLLVIKVHARTINATIGLIASTSITRLLRRSLNTNQAQVATLIRANQRTINASQNQSVSLNTGVSQTHVVSLYMRNASTTETLGSMVLGGNSLLGGYSHANQSIINVSYLVVRPRTIIVNQSESVTRSVLISKFVNNTQGQIVTINRQILHVLNGTENISATVNRSMGHHLATTQGTNIVLLESSQRVRIFIVTQNENLIRSANISKIIPLSQSSSVVITKRLSRNLATTQGQSAIVASNKFFIRTLQILQGTSSQVDMGAISKALVSSVSINLLRNVAVSCTFRIQQSMNIIRARNLSNTIDASQAQVANVFNHYARGELLTTSISTNAQAASISSRLNIFLITESIGSTLAKRVFKTFSLTLTPSVNVTHTRHIFAPYLITSVLPVSTIGKSKTISILIVQTPTISEQKSISKTIIFVENPLIAITDKTNHIVNGTIQNTITSLRKTANPTKQPIVTSVPTMIFSANKTIHASEPVFVFKTKNFPETLLIYQANGITHKTILNKIQRVNSGLNLYLPRTIYAYRTLSQSETPYFQSITNHHIPMTINSLPIVRSNAGKFIVAHIDNSEILSKNIHIMNKANENSHAAYNMNVQARSIYVPISETAYIYKTFYRTLPTISISTTESFTWRISYILRVSSNVYVLLKYIRPYAYIIESLDINELTYIQRTNHLYQSQNKITVDNLISQFVLTEPDKFKGVLPTMEVELIDHYNKDIIQEVYT